MSLQRLLLRTAFVRCLTNKTLAGGLVYDSRMTPVQSPNDDQQLPSISVYTEDDFRTNMQQGSGSPLYKRTVDVVLELAVGSFKNNPDDEDGQYWFVGETDPEVEALLDILEAQVWRAIQNGVDPDALALNAIVKGISDWSSIAGRAKADETNIRIAARRLTLQCWIADDCLVDQAFGTAVAPEDPAQLAPPIYANAPYLLPLLTAICSQPNYATVLQTLSEINGGVDALPDAVLEKFGMTYTNTPRSEPGDHVETIEAPIDVS